MTQCKEENTGMDSVLPLLLLAGSCISCKTLSGLIWGTCMSEEQSGLLLSSATGHKNVHCHD